MGSSSPREAPPAGATWRCRAPFVVIAGLFILLPYLLRLEYLERRGFNPDEFQHLHSAWCISEGLVPYRDYFEHHTPWLHFLLAGVVPLYDVGLEPTDAESFIFLARRAMWVLTGGILTAVFCLGRRLLGMPVAMLAVVFLGNNLMFLGKTLEIRPDVPATLFVLGSLAFLVDPSVRRRPELRFLASGFLLGSAVMFTQKVLFGLPGVAVALLLHVYDSDKRRAGISRAAFLGLGFVVPILATAGYFALRGGLAPFVEYNFLMNLRWKARYSPWPLFEELAQQNPFHLALGLVGLGMACYALRRAEARKRGEAFLALPGLSFLVGAFLIPVPHRQYALQFLPFLALYAALTLRDLVFAGSRDLDTSLSRAVATSSVVGIGAMLFLAFPTLSSPLFFTFMWLAVLGVVSLLLFRRQSRWIILALLLVPLSLNPLFESRVFWERRNWSTLRNLSWVIENVSPQESVLDGFSGLGVFRPHAFFYYFLHDEMLLMLEDSDWRPLERRLSDPEKAPKLVVDDRFMARAPGRVRALVERNYRTAGPSPIRAHWNRSAWSDAGARRLAPHFDSSAAPRLPYVLVEDGWYGPEKEDGITFRRSRGRRSRLLLPIAEPRDVWLELSARRLFEEPSLRIELALNGTVAGELSLESGWHNYRFSVPARLLKEGFNDILLTYSKTPRQADPMARGRNTVLALHSITLTPRSDGIAKLEKRHYPVKIHEESQHDSDGGEEHP